MILDHPIVQEIFNYLEQEALTHAVNASPSEPEIASAYLAETRAIRKFRSNLMFIIAKGTDEKKRNPTKT